MNPITVNITIAEIANGVIVTTDRSEGYGLSSPLARGSYYPSRSDAEDALPQILDAAWKAAEEQQARYADEMRGQVAEKAYYSNGPGVGVTLRSRSDDVFIQPAKLPEEAAASGDDEMIRTDPVMTTKSFEPVARFAGEPLYPVDNAPGTADE